MNLIRKTATTFGTIFFAALLITALAPKATRGVAAALVQVTNTASNTIPTEDGPGNFPFGAKLCSDPANVNCGSSASVMLVPLTTSTGAAVKRLVIEDVSSFCNMRPGDEIATLIRVPLPADNVMAGQARSGPFILEYSFPGTLAGEGEFAVSHSPVRIYADPGAEIDTQTFGAFADSGGVFCDISLTGHLETK